MSIPDEKPVFGCGDDSCEMLVSPMPTLRSQTLSISVRPRKRRAVFIDANKPNSLAILQRAKTKLETRGIEVAEIGRKGRTSRPMEVERLDALRAEEGLVLLGVAD